METAKFTDLDIIWVNFEAPLNHLATFSKQTRLVFNPTPCQKSAWIWNIFGWIRCVIKPMLGLMSHLISLGCQKLVEYQWKTFTYSKRGYF